MGRRAPSDPVRWHQLVDPEKKKGAAGRGTFVTHQQLASGGWTGGPGIVHDPSASEKMMEDWMGRRAEVEANGIPLVIGCNGAERTLH